MQKAALWPRPHDVCSQLISLLMLSSREQNSFLYARNKSTLEPWTMPLPSFWELMWTQLYSLWSPIIFSHFLKIFPSIQPTIYFQTRWPCVCRTPGYDTLLSNKNTCALTKHPIYVRCRNYKYVSWRFIPIIYTWPSKFN